MLSVVDVRESLDGKVVWIDEIEGFLLRSIRTFCLQGTEYRSQISLFEK